MHFFSPCIVLRRAEISSSSEKKLQENKSKHRYNFPNCIKKFVSLTEGQESYATVCASLLLSRGTLCAHIAICNDVAYATEPQRSCARAGTGKSAINSHAKRPASIRHVAQKFPFPRYRSLSRFLKNKNEQPQSKKTI